MKMVIVQPVNVERQEQCVYDKMLVLTALDGKINCILHDAFASFALGYNEASLHCIILCFGTTFPAATKNSNSPHVNSKL